MACSSVTVILAPSNTARELGKNITLACIVSDEQPSESVQWKHKPTGKDAFNTLTFNDNILASQTKYAIQWTYNLTIHNLLTSDAGLYRCTAGGRNYDATLTVIDLPKNVSIQWNGEPKSGEAVNLTCTAENGTPPPLIRWSVNGIDMTSRSVQVNTSDSVYSDVTSYLPLVLDESMNGQVAECIISYEGWENAMKAMYTIQTKSSLQGSASGKSGLFLLRFQRQTAGEKVDFELQHIP